MSAGRADVSEYVEQPQHQPQAVEPKADEPEAIFVVGASRSGTSLMRHLLERSDRIALARENHFLGHLRPAEGARIYFRAAGDLSDDETMRRIVELIYSGEFQRRSRWREISTFWHWLVETVPAHEMTDRLLAAERTERGVMKAFLQAYADRLGRPIIGEKTPAHIRYVDTLLTWFPNGRVIHMLRDPRAVYVSDLRRRRNKLRKPYSWLNRVPGALPFVLLVQTVFVWRDAVRRHRVYVARYPHRYRLVRFEDLVSQPDATLRGVYDFLGVEMPANATQVSVVSQGFRGGEAGLDAQAATRWRDHINPVALGIINVLLRSELRRFGYHRSSEVT
jgi:hypothetical protein